MGYYSAMKIIKSQYILQMDEPWKYGKWKKTERTSIVWFHVCERSREANLWKQKSEDFTRSYEYVVSFWGDKNVQQLESGDYYKYNSVNTLNTTEFYIL